MKATYVILAMLGLLTSCGGAKDIRTMLVLQIETDLTVPSQLDAIDITVSRRGAVRQQQVLEADKLGAFPIVVGLLQVDGAGTEVQVDVKGRLGNLVVAQEQAIANFVEGQSRVLTMFLAAECAGKTCDAALTCTRGGVCRPVLRKPSELLPYMPGGPTTDGSTGDAPATTKDAPETLPDSASNNMDADSDAARCSAGLTQCGQSCVDTLQDSRHCGDCKVDCRTLPGVNPEKVSCAQGKCVISGCLPARGNCSGRVEDGCETDLTRHQSCGDCASQCTSAQVCAMGANEPGCVSTCISPKTICDGSCVNVTNDVNHCGSCAACNGRSNAIANCTNSQCLYGCIGGYGDCDGDRVNGCEADIDNDPKHCGSCAPCASHPFAKAGCKNAGCTYSCSAARGDCNGGGAGADADGCEIDTSSNPLHCGGCNNQCPPVPANAIATCASGTCGWVCQPGYANTGTRCLAFGGAFETNAAGQCMVNNPFTAACSCAAGLGKVNYAIDGRGATNSTLTLCQSPGLAVPTDWYGAWLYDANIGSCVTNDPYSGTCNCPPGATELNISTRTNYYHPASLRLCYSAIEEARRSFFGAYQKYDNVSGLGCFTDATLKQICIAANPLTGGCSCPANTVEIPIVSFENGWDTPTHQGGCPTRIVFCVR